MARLRKQPVPGTIVPAMAALFRWPGPWWRQGRDPL